MLDWPHTLHLSTPLNYYVNCNELSHRFKINFKQVVKYHKLKNEIKNKQTINQEIYYWICYGKPWQNIEVLVNFIFIECKANE